MDAELLAKIKLFCVSQDKRENNKGIFIINENQCDETWQVLMDFYREKELTYTYHKELSHTYLDCVLRDWKGRDNEILTLLLSHHERTEEVLWETLVWRQWQGIENRIGALWDILKNERWEYWIFKNAFFITVKFLENALQGDLLKEHKKAGEVLIKYYASLSDFAIKNKARLDELSKNSSENWRFRESFNKIKEKEVLQILPERWGERSSICFGRASSMFIGRRRVSLKTRLCVCIVLTMDTKIECIDSRTVKLDNDYYVKNTRKWELTRMNEIEYATWLLTKLAKTA